MMISRGLTMFALMINSIGIQAGNSQWLRQMIDNHGSAAEYKRVKIFNKKDKGFFSSHGLILFYSSQCPHCRQFAPVLKKWANHHFAEVLPLSFDNQPLPEFPQFLQATTEWVNVAFQGNAINYPALFVVNPASNALYPVGFGSMTDYELNVRMKVLIPKINEFERKGSSL
jgi:type-F conjugative transfer system pilin assembly thiol-disulfide isomerase TrbB